MHRRLLTVRKGNGHYACAECIKEDKSKKPGVKRKQQMFLSALGGYAATDIASPWCEACRHCSKKRADPKGCVIHNDEAAALAKAMSEEIKDTIPHIALLCTECKVSSVGQDSGSYLDPNSDWLGLDVVNDNELT